MEMLILWAVLIAAVGVLAYNRASLTMFTAAIAITLNIRAGGLLLIVYTLFFSLAYYFFHAFIKKNPAFTIAKLVKVVGALAIMIGGIVSVLHDSHDHGDAHGAAPHAEVASSVHPDHDGHEDH